jgi:hypothetical protein
MPEISQDQGNGTVPEVQAPSIPNDSVHKDYDRRIKTVLVAAYFGGILIVLACLYQVLLALGSAFASVYGGLPEYTGLLVPVAIGLAALAVYNGFLHRFKKREEAIVASGQPLEVSLPTHGAVAFVGMVIVPNLFYILVATLLMWLIRLNPSIPESMAYLVLGVAGLAAVYWIVREYRNNFLRPIGQAPLLPLTSRALAATSATFTFIATLAAAVIIGFFAFLIADETYHPIE